MGGVLFVCMAGTFLSVLFLLMLLFLCWCSVHICVTYFARSYQGRANCLSYRLTFGGIIQLICSTLTGAHPCIERLLVLFSFFLFVFENTVCKSQWRIQKSWLNGIVSYVRSFRIGKLNYVTDYFNVHVMDWRGDGGGRHNLLVMDWRGGGGA